MNQFKKTAFITLCILTMPFAFGGNDWVYAGTSDSGISDVGTSDSGASNIGTSDIDFSDIDISDIGVYIDGAEVDFPDTKPYISNSRTLVPARFVVEQLGASITWDNDTGTVSIDKGADSITLTIGSMEMGRNGVSSTMDVAPVITDSRTMVPLRFVSEQFGVVVEWDVEKNSAMLTTKETERPREEGKEISLDCSAEEMITYAKEYLGVPYLYNGTTPGGFDCSGFTQYVMAHFGGILPHSSGDQYYYGTSVERKDLEPGDLVFFEASDNPTEIGHVGIYIGDGEFIHAPQAGENVKITNLSNVYFDPRFYGAIRMDTEEQQ